MNFVNLKTTRRVPVPVGGGRKKFHYNKFNSLVLLPVVETVLGMSGEIATLLPKTLKTNGCFYDSRADLTMMERP
jgi:hypothetical protein